MGTAKLASGRSIIFEHEIAIMAPPSSDPASELYPVHLHTPLNPYSSFTDNSTSWRVADDNAPAPVSPRAWLMQNQFVTFDMLYKYSQDPVKKRPPPSQPSASEEHYNILLENVQQSNFEITRDKDRIATLTVVRTLCRAGEAIVGHLLFKDADLTTFQVKAELEMQETVGKGFAHGGVDQDLAPQSITSIEQVVWMRDRYTFRLGTPLALPPTLYSALTRRKYRLKLTLHVADPRSHMASEELPKWLGSTPDSPFVEQFTLAIPITVVPLRTEFEPCIACYL